MRYALGLPVVLALACLACGSAGGTSPNSPTPSNMSTLTVSLKDSPFSDAKALLVTFSAVTAHRTGGDFSTLPFSGSASSRTCDLKKLTSATDVLGTGPLSPGHYTMLRLVVSSAAIYFDNQAPGPACAPSIAAPAGRKAAVDVPSGEVRLNREFDLTASNATTILLDFNGDQSIRQTGNGQYMMAPVITIVSVQ
jgi:Domain of unknown function (DUF4382)